MVTIKGQKEDRVAAYLEKRMVLILLERIMYLIKMLMYGKEARNRKQEIERQHHIIPNPKNKDCILDSFVVMTGFTMNLIPSNKVINTEKLPIVVFKTILVT